MTDVDASLLYFCSLVARHNKVTLTENVPMKSLAAIRGSTARNF